MMDRRSFFGVAVASAVSAATTVAFGRRAAVPAAPAEALPPPAVEQSRGLRFFVEDVALRPLPASPSGWDSDVLIVDHIQVRCCVSRELIADSGIDVCAEVEKRIAMSLFKRIDASWGAVAGGDDYAEVYPIRKWGDEERGIVEFRRGALWMKPDPNKPHPYCPPRGHVIYPLTKSFRFFDS